MNTKETRLKQIAWDIANKHAGALSTDDLEDLASEISSVLHEVANWKSDPKKLIVGENLGLMDYLSLRDHVGHPIALEEVTDWKTNAPVGLEIRCKDPACQNCEALLSIDN